MKLLLIILTLALSIPPFKSDLPVHCLAKHISGPWTFYLTSLQSSYPSCGHQHPDKNTDHLASEFRSTFPTNETLSLSLSLPNTVQAFPDNKPLGTWTMVYDEGFEVRTADSTFFAFSKYRFFGSKAPKDTDDEETKGYESLCNETFQGWVRNRKKGLWGCFYGVKETDNVNQRDSIFEKSMKSEKNNDERKIVERRDLMLTNKDHTSSRNANGPISSESQASNDYFEDMRLYERFQQNQQLYEIPHSEYLSNPDLPSEEQFIPDFRFIEYINDERINSPWKAKFHESLFSNKTHQEMRRLLGINRYKAARYQLDFLQISESHDFQKPPPHKSLKKAINKQNVQKPFSFQSSPADALPKSFDWRSFESQNYDTPIKKQGDCGSCYALSTLSMIEARIRVKSGLKHRPFLSSSGALSCSPYNQGCNGGYPFLVAKDGAERGFFDEACSPLLGDRHCEERCYTEGRLWKLEDYGYVGKGYYGSTSEETMMSEIYRNGPVVVALNASPDLYYYSTGVFITNPQKSLRQSNDRNDVKDWMYTNHAVVCVGWGEAEHNGSSLKYWILKNSWGEDWGEAGYFRFLRGKNLAGIENQAVFASPLIE